jgi:hypothetical protein
LVLYAYVCVCAFSLRRESPNMILGDRPLIYEVVLSQLHRGHDPLWHRSGVMHHCHHAIIPLRRRRLRSAFDLQPHGMETPYTLPEQRLKIYK